MATPAPPMFGMDMVDIAQEASERAGIEFRAGYSLRTARISLELLSIEWGNRGLNLWTIDRLVIPLARDDREIPLPDDTIDVIDHYIRAPQGVGGPVDLPLERKAQTQYATIPNKFARGRPSIITVLRNIHPSVLLWMVPDKDDYWELHLVRLKRMAALAEGGTGTPEIPFRFLNAMIAGLAYYMSVKSKDQAVQQKVPMLKADYEEQFDLAAAEDRDRASVFLAPGVMAWH
jgi:hypothetical protein